MNGTALRSLNPRASLRRLANRLPSAIERRVRIDTRTLAVFRVSIGLLIVADLLLRSRNFSYFYVDGGVVPHSLARLWAGDAAFSFYYFTSDPAVTALLFVVQGLFAVQLVAGYKTRFAAIVSFLFVISLDNVNPLVLSYADLLFRLLVFWAVFLPLGERWSVDAVHARSPPRPQFAGVASALILLQMVFMYTVNAYHKTQSSLWTGGNLVPWDGGRGVPLVFGIDEMTFLLGDFMRNFPPLLQYGGVTWFYMLLFSVFLILLRGRARTLFAGTFIAGHAAFAATVRIGAFPYVGIAGVMLFLQASFWEDAAAVRRRLGVHDAWSTRVRRLERLGTRLAERVPRGRPELYGGDAIRLATYRLALGVVVVSIVVNPALANLAAAGGMEVDRGATEQLDEVIEGFNLDQPPWTIFAPTPRHTDRYYVFPAETADGELLDVYNDRELTFERPYDGRLQKQHDTYRERFYMNSLRRSSSHVGPHLGEHFCETWAEERGVELERVNMYVVHEEITLETLDDGAARDRNREALYAHGCGDNPSTYINLPADTE